MAANKLSGCSFISGTPTTDVNYKPHVHLDPALLKIFHEKERLSAKFIVELYDVEDWTVFPTSFSANGFGIGLSVPCDIHKSPILKQCRPTVWLLVLG